jgi:hypothetical protein
VSEDSPTRATQAAGKKSAAAMKKKGVGLFKPVTQSAALAKVTGISGKASRLAITKALWAFIKKKVPLPRMLRREVDMFLQNGVCTFGLVLPKLGVCRCF